MRLGGGPSNDEIRGDWSNLKATDYHLVYVLWLLLRQRAATVVFYAGNDLLAAPVTPIRAGPTDEPPQVTVVAKVTGLTAEDALATPFLALGTHDEFTEHLLACRECWGISNFTVRQVEAFPPMIQRLERLDATVGRRS